MIKEAIDRIVELASTKIFEIDGCTYSDQRLNRIPPVVDRPSEISVSGLNGICQLIRAEIDRIGTTVFVQADSYCKVSVFTTYLHDYSRNYLYTAKADVPGFASGFRERENALIELRSLFIPNEGMNYLLDLLSRLTNESSTVVHDNGVTQTVEAKQGVALKTTLEVKPRVNLLPFRTFLEVPQPESEFILRIDDRGRIGLFEADGGVWKLEAKRNISDYLSAELRDLIEAGRVIVMM